VERRHYDEMRTAEGEVRAHFRALADWLAQTPAERVAEKRREADLLFHRVGITFAVYGDAHGASEGAERLIPFDTIPRVIPGAEWDELAKGLRQRVSALNRFLHDIYHDQEILKAGLIPAEQVLTNEAYQVAMLGLELPNRVYSHVAGIDLIRHEDGQYYVLEDNLRTPSGVSYMLENRKMMMRLFPELFARQHVHPVEHYPGLLLETLSAAAPPSVRDPVVVVLTPGQHNSAYFEHAFLAQQMGVPLVEGADLFVDTSDRVWMRTIDGPTPVDVIYRRIDDLFLDPEVFRKDSHLGVPGLIRSWCAGNVAIANAPGAGVADDKVVYAWAPDFIRYYLDEEPLLPNVPTYRCLYDDEFDYVVEHASELVLKPANESGGYGLTIGNSATPEQLEVALAAIKADPRNWVAQPILKLSTAPTLCDGELAPRHVDLRPFVLSGRDTYVTMGGLTRVALVGGSLVVNSSQGGGSKDTWVVEDS
jgi:uncharacterized circularly permuted ATP-grasp superfamily protein